MAGNLTLGAYWGPRRESAPQCAERLQRYLGCLRSIDSVLDCWRYRSRLLEVGSVEEITQLFAKGTNRSEVDGSTIDDLGLSISLTNGLTGARAVHLKVLCGAYTNPALRLWNNVILELPRDLGDMARAETMRQLVMLHDCCWEATWASIFGSMDLRNRTRPFDRGNPRLGRIAYIAKSFGLPARLPPSASVETLGHGYLIVTPESG